MTKREVVSEIINDLRAHQVDDRVSERYVLSKLTYYNGLFLKRENDQLKLFYDNNIWTPVDCIKLETVDNSECTDVRIPLYISLSRSVEPIPEIYSYSHGPIIREVSPVAGNKTYLPTTPNDYLKILKREYRDPRQKYYWFQGQHLIIPDSNLTTVNLTACFVDSLVAKRLSSCTETSACAESLDEQFPCPAHLAAIVKQETIKDLFNFYKRNIRDEVADLDTNNKTEKGGSPRNGQ